MGNTDKFEMIAKTYDTPERVNIAHISVEAVRTFLDDTKDASALDFGCGTGLVGLELIHDFKMITFLDTAHNMIIEVQRKLDSFGIENAQTLCFDLENQQLEDLRVDYIFMTQVLLHIKDVEIVLARLYRLLNAGGQLIIVDFDKNENVSSSLIHNGFKQTELVQQLQTIGYHQIQAKTFYEGQKILMGQDGSMFVLTAQKQK